MNTYRGHFRVPNVQATVVLEIRAGDKFEAEDAARTLELHLDLDFMLLGGE